MNIEQTGRAICAALNLNADEVIPVPVDQLQPLQPAGVAPRWQVAGELAERQRVLAEAVAP